MKPTTPIGGDVVGARPIFEFAVEGVTAAWEATSPPVIDLSQDHWKTVERSYSMSRGPERGWTLFSYPEGKGKGRFRCPEDLPEGLWEWRARLERVPGPAAPKSASFRVDATPPAEVEGLIVRRRRDGSIALSWQPVVEDIEEKPETVDHYAIYRYEARGTFPQIAPMRIGESRAAGYVDRKPPPRAGERIAIYYKVVAVDLAGNELGVRDSSSRD